MPSWVAPSLAADLWNTSEEDIRRRITDGSIAVRYDGGFCFVNVGTPEALPQATPAVMAVHEEAPQWTSIRPQTARLRRAPRKAA